jgi:hypothetical protein
MASFFCAFNLTTEVVLSIIKKKEKAEFISYFIADSYLESGNI